MQDVDKTSESEIVCLNKIYKFIFTHFLIKCILVVGINENTFEYKKFGFLTKVCKIWRNDRMRNCLHK